MPGHHPTTLASLRHGSWPELGDGGFQGTHELWHPSLKDAIAPHGSPGQREMESRLQRVMNRPRRKLLSNNEYGEGDGVCPRPTN